MKKILTLLSSAFLVAGAWAQNMENGHEYVDLGLSVKWATTNVGATAPQEYGWYIEWGETEEKEYYGWKTYKHTENGKSDSYYTSVYNYINKYQTADNNRGGTWYDADLNFIGDNKTTLDPEDDAAHVNWGGDWAMPSKADWDELCKYCTHTWTTQNGVNGLLFSRYGKSIFLPAAGYRDNDKLDRDDYGYYWSSSLDEDYSVSGCNMEFYSSGYINLVNTRSRSYGQSIRPVCPSAGNTNGHEAVNFTLPSGKLWATCNVGASNPESVGKYIAWGETKDKEYYDLSTYKHMKKGSKDWQDINKYTAADKRTGAIWYKGNDFIGDDIKTLEKADDAAASNWGDNWRMPTAAEWQELKSNTTQTWTDNYKSTGVAGYIITSKKKGHEGASIFLPAAGQRDGNKLYYDGSNGYYWSSSLHESNTNSGYLLDFRSSRFNAWTSHPRYYGFSVRPVFDDPNAAATAVESVKADKSQKTLKTIENGRVVIIRDGKKYDLSGREL